MVTVVKKWGNSIGIRLPKALAEEAAIGEGSPVTLEARNGQLIIKPVGRRRYRLAELVRHITPRNRHEAVDSGRPCGKEAW